MTAHLRNMLVNDGAEHLRIEPFRDGRVMFVVTVRRNGEDAHVYPNVDLTEAVLREAQMLLDDAEHRMRGESVRWRPRVRARETEDAT